MQIIIIGCGKVGSKFAEVISRDGHDVVIVDNDHTTFANLDPDFNGITVTGVPIDQDVLKKAGIETADALAAVTPDDNVNIMVCQVAKEIFKVPKVIARIYNPAREHVFHQFGLETICPTNITVDVIRSFVQGNIGETTHTIGNNLFSFKHEMVSSLDEDKMLSEIMQREKNIIFGVIQKGQFVFANPNLQLSMGDIIVISKLLD